MRAMNRAQLVLARFDAAEYRFCRGLNRAAARAPFRGLMRLASRAGDGPLWGLLLAALPLAYGAAAIRPALAIAATGLAGHLVYSRLKSTLVRERPFMRHAGINLEMPPLDRYSFPSGHTLHAVCFSLQASAFDHALAWLLVPLAGLIALSRVALGLHYPTDVIAGAAIGALLAAAGLALG
jgi:undecaprenyl-diphosphatase